VIVSKSIVWCGGTWLSKERPLDKEKRAKRTQRRGTDRETRRSAPRLKIIPSVGGTARRVAATLLNQVEAFLVAFASTLTPLRKTLSSGAKLSRHAYTRCPGKIEEKLLTSKQAKGEAVSKQAKKSCHTATNETFVNRILIDVSRSHYSSSLKDDIVFCYSMI